MAAWPLFMGKGRGGEGGERYLENARFISVCEAHDD